MAPIYTARHVGGGKAVSPLFKLKGLANLAPAPLSQLGLYGIAFERQVAYTEYSNNIYAFLYASAKNVRVRIDGRCLETPDFTHGLPLTAPPVSFTLEKSMSHDQTEALVKSLGPGASKVKSGNITIFTAPVPPKSKVPILIQLASKHFNSGRLAVNPAGLAAFEFLSGAFGEFLRVHAYSAFHIESEETLVEIKQLVNVSGTEHRKFEGKKADVDRTEFSMYAAEVAEQVSTQTDDPEDPDGVAKFRESVSKANSYVTTSGKDSVPYARPPKEPGVNVGSIASIPAIPGILFPYFHGLIQPDGQLLLSFVHTHLFHLLGQTQQACQDRFSLLRRGINSLATHDVGMELAHIALGLELALSTQSRCYVIIDSNVYRGFALLGARFAVFDNTTWHAPESVEQIRQDLTVIDPHAKAVKSLVEVFGKLSTAGVYKGPAVTELTFSDPSNLIKVLKGLNLAEIGDDENEVGQLFRNLNYMGEGFVAQNPQNVTSVVAEIFSDSKLSLARPTYIPDIRTDISSREFIGLSRFGPEAPSFWNERGKEFSCTAKEVPVQAGQKRKIGDTDEYGNMPDRILITPKPLAVAVKDFGRMVSKKAVKMDLTERAGKNRNMNVAATDMRKLMWKTLVNGMAEIEPKKRRVEEKEDDEEGGVDLDGLLAELLA